MTHEDAGTADKDALDPQVLDGLATLDPGGKGRLVQRVLSTYQSSLARLSQQLADASAASDPAALRMAAHTLKSSSASVGALALSALCARAEQAARDGHDAELPGLVGQLLSEIGRVQVAVQQLLAP
ncbi:MAG: Hpt domain-containing protein [Burkholderiales bacterium]|nr:Hpt domain-containing protein [Burkholderiales bacterium]